MKMAEEKKEIVKDMTLGEVIQKHPETVPVMVKHGLHCIGCHIAALHRAGIRSFVCRMRTTT